MNDLGYSIVVAAGDGFTDDPLKTGGARFISSKGRVTGRVDQLQCTLFPLVVELVIQ